MPIKSCKIKGKRGYKFGKKGKCYKSRKKAVKQAQAISISKQRALDFNHKNWGKPNWGKE